MGKTEFITVMIMCVIATLMVPSVTAQTVHVVGESSGWMVPSNTDVYDNWADTKVFRVGDILTFNFATRAHDVVEVTEASYEACTITNIIGSIITTGPANITLTTVGEHRYICTFGTGRHCLNGQKLDIDVSAASPGTVAPPPSPSTPATPPPPMSTSGPATSPTTAPPPSSTNGPTMSPPATTPPPPSSNGPTTTSPPPPGSSSSIVLGSVFVTFVFIAFGLFL